MSEQLSLLDPPRGPATLSSFHVRSEMTVAEALAGQALRANQKLRWL